MPWFTVISLIIALVGLIVLSGSAEAKSKSVRIETVKKSRTVQSPLKILASIKGKPRKVTFAIDDRRLHIAFGRPYRLGGPDGSFDPKQLTRGRHQIIVRAYYGKGLRNRIVARSGIRVRKVRASRAAGQSALKITTRLPVARITRLRSQAVWDGSADIGFGPWASVQSGARDSQFGDSSIDIAGSPSMSGHKAFKFQVNSTDASNGPRAELLDDYELQEGQEWWWGDVLYIPSNPNAALGWENSNHSVMQWKNDGTGSPPLLLDLRSSDSRNGLGVQDLDGWHPVLPMSALYDKAVRIEVRVLFSSDPGRGSYEIWANDRRVYGPVAAQTLYPGLHSYYKEGQYGEGRGNVIYWQGAKRGTSRDAVTR
jgi:hypothetical protein